MTAGVSGYERLIEEEGKSETDAEEAVPTKKWRSIIVNLAKLQMQARKELKGEE